MLHKSRCSLTMMIIVLCTAMAGCDATTSSDAGTVNYSGSNSAEPVTELVPVPLTTAADSISDESSAEPGGAGTPTASGEPVADPPSNATSAMSGSGATAPAEGASTGNKNCANLVVTGTDSAGKKMLDLQSLDCADPTATYRASGSGDLLSGCPTAYLTYSTMTGTICLDLNLEVGECVVLGATDSDADQKLDCTAAAGQPGAVTFLGSISGAIAAGSQPESCPAETTKTLQLGMGTYCFADL